MKRTIFPNQLLTIISLDCAYNYMCAFCGQNNLKMWSHPGGNYFFGEWKYEVMSGVASPPYEVIECACVSSGVSVAMKPKSVTAVLTELSFVKVCRCCIRSL